MRVASSPLTAEVMGSAFRKRYGHEPAFLVRAPGRVNIIGEHTDYNEGFVLPMAINRFVWIALSPRTDQRLVLYARDVDQPGDFHLENFSRGNEGWLEYVKGIAWGLKQAGSELTGWEGVLAGDVPIGAGLSSSAALEMAVARSFAAVSVLEWRPLRMAKIGQRAENEWVGVRCGIMDQLISAAGQNGSALFIDCRSLESEPLPLPAGTAVVVMDTATRRGLAGSAYNERRRQCEEAAAFLGLTSLRDLTPERFEARAHELATTIRARARHVIGENARTLAAVSAMRRGSAGELGRLMVDSHASLRDDYEVSSPALNAIVDCANGHPACFGARMTGAGFGGCAVALVQREAVAGFTDMIAACYREAMGMEARLYVVEAAHGAEALI